MKVFVEQHFWLASVLLFGFGAICDVIWISLIRAQEEDSAYLAGFLSMLLVVISFYGFSNSLHNQWLILPLVLGHGVGTFATVMRRVIQNRRGRVSPKNLVVKSSFLGS